MLSRLLLRILRLGLLPCRIGLCGLRMTVVGHLGLVSRRTRCRPALLTIETVQRRHRQKPLQPKR